MGIATPTNPFANRPGPVVTRRTLMRGALLGAAGGLLAACGGNSGSDSGSGGGGSGGGGGGGTQTWRMGMPELKADSVFQALGVSRGFFEEQGIAAEIVPIASGTTTARGLISGELEFATAGPGPFFASIASGAGMTFIGSLFTKVPHLMYARKEIGGLEDLVGKSVGGGQPGALLQQLAYASFLQAGLDPDAVQYVNIGGSPDVFLGVVGGTVDAGVAGSEYVLELDADPSMPVKVLFNIGERLPNYMRNGDVVSTRLLEEDRDLVLRATAAYIKGARYAAENKDEAIEWAMSETGATEEGAEATWEEYVNQNLVNLDYAITEEQLNFTQEISVSSGDLDEVLPFDKIADPTVVEEAMALL